MAWALAALLLVTTAPLAAPLQHNDEEPAMPSLDNPVSRPPVPEC